MRTYFSCEDKQILRRIQNTIFFMNMEIAIIFKAVKLGYT